MRTFLTAREKLRSPTLAKRVVSELGLAEHRPFFWPAPDFAVRNIFHKAYALQENQPGVGDWTAEERERHAIARLTDDLFVQLVPNTSLLSITFRDQDPVLAAEISNQVARSFIDQRVDQTSETSELARQFIQEQVFQVKEKLQASEEALVQYSKDAGITVTGNDRSLIASHIETLNTALAEAIQERLDYGRLVSQIENGQGESLEQVLGSEGLGTLRSRIAELSGEYQQKLSMFKPGFPEMVQLRAQIGELRRQLDGGVIAITDSIRLKHLETIEKEKNLQQALAVLEKQQIAFNDKSIQYTILKREVESNRSQYDNLINKLNDAGVSSELRTASASIVDMAVTPSKPYSPRLSLNLGLGLLLFLAASAAIIYLLELVKNTFTSTEQVEKELGLPVLGILPMVGGRDFISTMADRKSALSEAYRTLRTSLQFSSADGVPKVLLVTSPEPDEGKTTTVFKLGQDFAALGARVLIIDGDLRKPGIHRVFGLDNGLGLSNLLTNTVAEEELPSLFKKTRFDELYVLTAGTVPPNPADLLFSPKMAAIVGNLVKRSDLVIIDAPPILGLSDAPILSRLADGTLLVITANQVTRKSASAALKRIRAMGSNVVGAALTKFRANKFDFNASDRHMNGQYYGYGKEGGRLDGSNPEENPKSGEKTPPAIREFSGHVRSAVSSALRRIKSTA
jgi:succinoglycan biosynthesis transport protein ExoP